MDEPGKIGNSSTNKGKNVDEPREKWSSSIKKAEIVDEPRDTSVISCCGVLLCR